MSRSNLSPRSVCVGVALWMAALFFSYTAVHADPSKYPRFAQQKLADNIKPVFITVDELVKEITAAKKPLIIDVRTAEEYHEAHILGAVSSPLGEFSAHLQKVPRDRPVVLY